MAPSWTESLGRWLWLAGVLLLIAGDAPSTPVAALAWPWLYLALLGLSFVCMAAAGRLRLPGPSSLRVLGPPVALLLGSFAFSSIFSQVHAVSASAFALVLLIVAMSWMTGALLDDDWLLGAAWTAAAAGTIVLAARVLAWRLDEGLGTAAFQVGNNAWLGKLQLTWVFVLLAPFLLARCLTESRRAHRALHGAAWLLAAAATYVLFSRAGAVAFALTTLGVYLLNQSYRRRWLGIVAVAAAPAIALLASSADRARFVIASLIDFRQNPGVDIRLGAFGDAIRLFRDHPVVGTGLGTFDHMVYTLPGTTADGAYFQNGWHAHNVFLQILTETGLVGLLAWCYLWYAVLAHLRRAWRDADRLARVSISAAGCVVLAFLVLSQTEALIGARVHASLRMNLLVGLVVVLGMRVARGQTPPVR